MEPFWIHFGSQNGAKINEKSIQNSIEFLDRFLIVSWMVFRRFLKHFGEPGPSFLSVSCRRGAIFHKITFFRPDSVLDEFLMDFEWFWEPFWGPFWDQNGIQKSIKKVIRFLIHFGGILAPKVAPFWTNFGSKNRSKIKVDF